MSRPKLSEITTGVRLNKIPKIPKSNLKTLMTSSTFTRIKMNSRRSLTALIKWRLKLKCKIIIII